MYVYDPFSQIQSQLHLFLNHNTILLDNFPEAIYKLKQQARINVPGMECCGHANCLCIPIDREESNERKDKRITIAQ